MSEMSVWEHETLQTLHQMEIAESKRQHLIGYGQPTDRTLRFRSTGMINLVSAFHEKAGGPCWIATLAKAGRAFLAQHRVELAL